MANQQSANSGHRQPAGSLSRLCPGGVLVVFCGRLQLWLTGQISRYSRRREWVNRLRLMVGYGRERCPRSIAGRNLIRLIVVGDLEKLGKRHHEFVISGEIDSSIVIQFLNGDTGGSGSYLLSSVMKLTN